MLNPYYLQKYARIRHDEFLAQARQERLARLIKSQQPRLSQRVRWQLGDWFIALGCKLKAQAPLAGLGTGLQNERLKRIVR